jgi:hypothetical protein
VRARPRLCPRCRSCAIESIVYRRFAMEGSGMVNSAIHNRFASHGQPRRAPDADYSHRGARRDGLAAAIVQGASRPRLSHPSAALVLAALLPLASRAQLLHSGAVDNGNNAPTPDASAATRISAELPLHCTRPPRPPARTTGEFQHSLAGLEIAVGFEGRQTAALQELPWERIRVYSIRKTWKSSPRFSAISAMSRS